MVAPRPRDGHRPKGPVRGPSAYVSGATRTSQAGAPAPRGRGADGKWFGAHRPGALESPLLPASPHGAPPSGRKPAGISQQLQQQFSRRHTLVRVHTDDGFTGIGQCEAPSLVIHAIVHNSMGLKRLLTGEDPREVQRLWQKMYNATGLYGRHGVTMGAIGAVETALWDIAGQAAGMPVHRLIWKSFATTATEAAPRKAVTPYVTVYPPGDDLPQLRDRL